MKERLLKIKDKIQPSNEEMKMLEGRLQALQDRLRNEFDCDSFEEAERVSKKHKKDAEKLNEEIEAKLCDLEEELR